MNYTPDPIAFSIFGIDIRWYAVLICAGLLLAWGIAQRRIARRSIDSDAYFDVVLFSVIFGVIGARAWYVIFEWENYHSFFDIINTRAGGLAIQGGLIFGFTTCFIMSRIKKVSFWDCIDTAVPCIALAQAIGRWGNYFNQEAHGTVTDLPWGILIDGQYVHPTFLYESLWCLGLFIVLSLIDRRRRFRGQILSLYLMLYSIERILVEQLRTDSLLAGPSKQVIALKVAGYDPAQVDGVIHIGKLLLFPFRTAQFISLCCIILGLILFFVMRRLNIGAGSEDINNDINDIAEGSPFGEPAAASENEEEEK